MVQIYFLLVLINLVLGLILVADKYKEEENFLSKLYALTTGELFNAIAGILAILVGFFGLFVVMAPDFPVVGNLLPSLSSISLGMIFLFSYYKAKNPESPGFLPALEGLLLGNKLIFGAVSLVTALLHFLFPTGLLI